MTIDDLKFSAREVVGLILWASSIVGLYFALSSKQDTVVLLLNAQAATVAKLEARIDADAAERTRVKDALITLTATLQAKDIIK